MPDTFKELAAAYNHNYTPKTFNETVNTLACHIASGVESKHWPGEGHRPVVEFQAEHLLQAGYVLVYLPGRANRLLQERKT